MGESIKHLARIWWHKLNLNEQRKLMKKYNCHCRTKDMIKIYSREISYIKK